MSKVSIGAYKGHPTISLGSDSKYPFTFGVAKAALILEHIDAIKRFVGTYVKTPPGSGGGDRFDMAVEDNMRDQCGLNGGAR